ncbi:MAG: hypothetical protein IPK07_18290 [Deltaproteobacteria bacterium]|nr:hypothetical protein [Deltaproteobacteria bacterium]
MSAARPGEEDRTVPNPPIDETSASGSFTLDGHPEVRTCVICGRVLHRRDVVRATSVRPLLAGYLTAQNPGKWTGEGHLCRRCLNHARVAYVLEHLEQERGELSKVEAEVAQKAGQHITIAQNIDEQFQRTVTRGQRTADVVARWAARGAS